MEGLRLGTKTHAGIRLPTRSQLDCCQVPRTYCRGPINSGLEFKSRGPFGNISSEGLGLECVILDYPLPPKGKRVVYIDSFWLTKGCYEL